MNVQELIDALSRLSEEEKKLPVFTEGCDCIGFALGIKVDRDSRADSLVILITRDHDK